MSIGKKREIVESWICDSCGKEFFDRKSCSLVFRADGEITFEWWTSGDYCPDCNVKLANGITDSSVTMSAKAHLRNNRPLVIALATNDALSANLINIGKLLSRKNVFFVPLRQDDPANKPTSMIADFKMIPQTLDSALSGRQLMPIF